MCETSPSGAAGAAEHRGCFPGCSPVFSFNLLRRLLRKVERSASLAVAGSRGSCSVPGVIAILDLVPARRKSGGSIRSPKSCTLSGLNSPQRAAANKERFDTSLARARSSTELTTEAASSGQNKSLIKSRSLTSGAKSTLHLRPIPRQEWLLAVDDNEAQVRLATTTTPMLPLLGSSDSHANLGEGRQSVRFDSGARESPAGTRPSCSTRASGYSYYSSSRASCVSNGGVGGGGAGGGGGGAGGGGIECRVSTARPMFGPRLGTSRVLQMLVSTQRIFRPRPSSRPRASQVLPVASVEGAKGVTKRHQSQPITSLKVSSGPTRRPSQPDPVQEDSGLRRRCQSQSQPGPDEESHGRRRHQIQPDPVEDGGSSRGLQDQTANEQEACGCPRQHHSQPDPVQEGSGDSRRHQSQHDPEQEGSGRRCQNPSQPNPEQQGGGQRGHESLPNASPVLGVYGASGAAAPRTEGLFNAASWSPYGMSSLFMGSNTLSGGPMLTDVTGHVMGSGSGRLASASATVKSLSGAFLQADANRGGRAGSGCHAHLLPAAAGDAKGGTGDGEGPPTAPRLFSAALGGAEGDVLVGRMAAFSREEDREEYPLQEIAEDAQSPFSKVQLLPGTPRGAVVSACEASLFTVVNCDGDFEQDLLVATSRVAKARRPAGLLHGDLDLLSELPERPRSPARLLTASTAPATYLE